MSNIVLITLLALLLLAIVTVTPLQSMAEPASEISYIDVMPPHGKQYSINERISGINCEDPSHIWISLYKNATLMKISKMSETIEGYYDAKNTPQQKSLPSKFYSIIRDPTTGNIFVNEESGARLWRFNPHTNEWVSIPLVKNLDIPENEKLSYGKSYELTPTTLKVDEKPAKHGTTAYKFNTTSNNDAIAFAKGYIWVGASHSIDFDEHAENFAGVVDYSFSGLIKIDPYHLTVERIALPGNIMPTMLQIDNYDNNIMWIGVHDTSKIYRFDLLKERIDGIIQVTEIPNATYKSLTTDANYVYVVSKEKETVKDDNQRDNYNSNNSKIIRINKQDPNSQTILEIGTTESNHNADAVFVVSGGINNTHNSILLWSDGSNHTGSVNVNTLAKKTFANNASDTVSYSSGCLSNKSEFWFTMTNSLKIGISNVDFNDATKFKMNAFGKVKSGDDTVRTVEAIITADIVCSSDNRIIAKPDSIRGIVRVDYTRQSAYYASFNQINATSIAFVVTDGQWGKITGIASFPAGLDCDNESGTSVKTYRNDITLLRYGRIFNLMNTTDNTVISFS